MPLLETVRNLPPFRFAETGTLRKLLLNSPFAGPYWRVAPAVFRRHRHCSPDHVRPGTDPFGLFLVDPDRITRFTGRKFPVWTNRWFDFGTVRDGDWDRRETPPIDPSYRGPDPLLYLADRFEETTLYEGLRAHFVDGVPWEDVEFVGELLRRVETEGTAEVSVWQDCKTAEDVRAYCDDLDQLYRDMATQGCLSMRELNRRNGRQMSFREVMEHEILVDVGRDGELLFALGRHRLGLAKILNLDLIPVAIAVRHRLWVERDGESARATPTGRQTARRSRHRLERPLEVSW